MAEPRPKHASWLTTNRAFAWAGLLALLLPLLHGCSVMQAFAPPVEVRQLKPSQYIALKRGDVLTTGHMSLATQETVTVAGLDGSACQQLNQPLAACRDALAHAAGISAERQLSALAEMWTQQALAIAQEPQHADAHIQAWLEAARYAYAYLFLTEREPRDRAFEDRQTQVRDYYNLATQEVANNLFTYRQQRALSRTLAPTAVASWLIQPVLLDQRITHQMGVPQDLIPASALSFRGLRSQYRRDGFGAELVAVMDSTATSQALQKAGLRSRYRFSDAEAWSEMPYPTITALLKFEGHSLAEVLATKRVVLDIYDPYVDQETTIGHNRIPLAGDFTAGYGLWLARSGFSKQSLRALLGHEHSIERPHVFMMQPYDPNRRILLMVHGLASSPEAWVNVANEVMGDEQLRKHFQVWQVYYPTNLPIALNHYDIRKALNSALAHFDPQQQHAASQQMVVIGHSMGGVIARLMVSSSGAHLLDNALANMQLEPSQHTHISRRLAPLFEFEPMPQVGRAIFIAAPHRGTDFAEARLGQWLAGLVRLPLHVLENFADVIKSAHANYGAEGSHVVVPNSINNLQEHDPFVKAIAELEIAPHIQYHSIIAQETPEQPLAQSSDGLVPYRSAHLAGAQSEKVIHSGHSVQETAQAIIEIRRILHQDLAAQAP